MIAKPCLVARLSLAWKALWPLAIGGLTAAGGLVAGLPARADEPLPLPAAVVAAAKTTVVPALEENGITSVGVLKFLAKDGSAAEATLSSRLGAINSDLAAQFQTAILLNISRHAPIAVLRDPSGVAAGIPGATHLTAEGLEKLFAADYPVVVGKPTDRVKPDALVFGVVQIAADLQTAEIDVRLAFRGRDGGISVAKLCTVTAGLRGDDLASAGQSFVNSRGAFSGGRVQPAASPAGGSGSPIRPVSLAADVRAGRRPFPLEDPEAPIRLSIAYDGAIQRIEYRDGGAFVAEPRQGQKVTITIEKARRDGQRYAVAVKVNGENTGERDTRPDLTASKWVLSDDFMKLPIRGFAVGTGAVQPFQVLSEADSSRRAFDYGVDAGTITMTVYAERTGASDAPPPPEVPQQIAAATAAGELDKLLAAGGVRLDPSRTFASLDEAKGSLSTTLASTVDRGMIVPDTTSESFAQKVVEFNTDPEPVMSAVIRYYTRR